MRTKYLNMIKIIDCVATKKQCSKDEIALYFGIKKGQYEDGNAPFGYRTLSRYLNELVQENVLHAERSNSLQNNKEVFYSISENLVDTETIEKLDFSKMILMLLECGEFHISKLVQEYLQEGTDVASKDVVEHYIRVIHEDHSYKKQEEMISIINEAILTKHDVSFDYSGQRKYITPICLLRNKNGTKLYLYGVRKEKLLPPFQIEKIKDITVESSVKTLNREMFWKYIEEAWDVDIEESKYVRIRVKEGNDDTEVVKKALGIKLEKVFCENSENVVYEGMIQGINDFKSWIREHMTTCIVEEPVKIRQEMYKALQEKLSRYEVDVDE